MLEFLQPFHPKIVHFPVALFFSALIFDLLSFVFKKSYLHQTAICTYILAVFTAPLAVLTGGWEKDALHLRHPILERHEFFATITMWFSLVSLPIVWFIQKKYSQYFRPIFFVCLIAASIFVTLAAHQGGRMVYEYGVGIRD